ncbi:MAG: RHS repeat-associated core domain-containing protein, partial [Terracidiphilus sp.]
VCEVSPLGTMVDSGSPVTCGTDITGSTGFTSTYSYALATGTTGIAQGVQTRTFQTDWLGRATSVKEPESGTATYSYAYNSTGLAVTRQRPKANQTVATVLTTTTTQYDLLGRALTITYTDGTPTKTFAYDASAGWSDLTQTNPKGRLSLASVSGVAGTIYSYDPMGRTSYLDECLPSGCGTVAYNRQLHYIFNPSGNLTSSTDGGGVPSTYTVSPANEILSLTSSLSNSNGMNPPAIVSGALNGPNGPVSYNLSNGLSSFYGYDGLGRPNGGWVCSGTPSVGCSGGTQTYGFTNAWKGIQLQTSSDSVLQQTSAYAYDGFNRLTSRTVTTGTPQNYTYVYDRYGNRWQQNPLDGGSTLLVNFNTSPSNNQILTAGYAYDAAGNLTNDAFYTYKYDGEGNIIQAMTEGGATVAQYIYNALNQRVRTVVGSLATEFVFNAVGQRVSIWNGTTRVQLQGEYYLGGKPVAYYANSETYFQHQDWLGTERERTTFSGGVEGTYTSLPFGDDLTTASGTDGDAYHYASLDHDYETDTDHAQFRQYSNVEGRWMAPDPYSGSYDFSNPQSFNRDAYVQDSPLGIIDPLGLTPMCYLTTTYTLTGILENNHGGQPVYVYTPISYLTCSGVGSGGGGSGGLVYGGGIGGGGARKSPYTVPGTQCSSGCHKEPFQTTPLNLNPCVALAVGSVPLSFTGVPAIAAYLEIGAGAANVLGWTGVAGTIGGVACM